MFSGSGNLNFTRLHVKNLVFEFTLRCEEIGLCFCVIFLLLFKTLDPHVPRFFFVCYLVVQTIDLFVELLLLQVKLPFEALLLYFDSFNVSLQVNCLLV